MNKPEFDPLLNDLLAESHYAEFRAGLKRQALGAFRRARLWRRARAAGLAVGAACAVVSMLLVRSERKQTAPILATVPEAAPSAASPSYAADQTPADALVRIETISDEQLLAAFPPGSCFLAEIDGQMVLVFSDPVLRDEVMR